MGERDIYDLLIKRMESLYGMDIPKEVLERYAREKNYLQSSEFQNEFMAFAELLMEMQEQKIRYSVIGTSTHSFLLYLLVQPEMNPLPPHYYCHQCRYIFFPDAHEGISMGIDLPGMKCRCGCELIANGFDLCETFFWEKEQLDLMLSVSEENYEYVKEWLNMDERLKGKGNEEEDWSYDDEEDIVKRYKIGIIVVLAEKLRNFPDAEFGWSKIRKYKDVVYDNYELLLPGRRKVKKHPRNFYELIRVVAFFHTMYTKSTERFVCEEDIIAPEEVYSLFEELYDGDIDKAPVFLEDGLMLGEWSVEDYNFLILHTRAFAEFVLIDINDKMKETIRTIIE